MGIHHHHSHEHSHGPGSSAGGSALGVAFAINLALAIFETIGGYLAGSVTIYSAAVHDFGDAAALGAVFFLERQSRRHRDSEFSYGYLRFSLLSSVVSAFVILFGTGMVVVESVPRLFAALGSSSASLTSPSEQWMFAVALVGIVANVWAALRVSKAGSVVGKMLRWHFVEDSLGWVVVLIGAAVLKVVSIPWLDPALSLLLSVWILRNVWRELQVPIRIFLQAKPPGFDKGQFVERVLKIPGVDGVHDLHAWSLDGNHHVLSMHLVHQVSYDKVPSLKLEVQKVANHYGHFHVTIETEAKGDPCNESCDQRE